MRILLISSFFYPHYGGSQCYMEEIYAQLIKSNPQICVDVLCYNTQGSPEEERYRGLNIYRVPAIQILPGQFALPNYFWLIRKIIMLAKKHHYDVISSNTRFFDHSWWTPFLAKILGAKSILTDHCANYPAHRSRLVTAIARIADRLGVLLFARFYDLTTVTSQAALDFAKRVGLKEPVLVYGGVDTSFFRPQCKGSKQEMIVSFVGRMIQTKGPELLFQAAKQLLPNHPRLHFVFAGSGEAYDRLKMYQKSPRIHLTGPLDRRQVADLLAVTDIFVHPSIHHEGFPNVILEAGACGCAVVATDNGGTKEVILHNKTGLLVEPNIASLKKALLFLVKNKRRRKKLAFALRQKVENDFDWRILAGQFQEAIDKRR